LPKIKQELKFTNKMKKLTIVLLFVFGINYAFSQTGVQINFDQLKKKVEKSNADIENPKKNIKEGTWIDRAELMMEIYESQLLNSRANMTDQEFILVAGQPKNRVQEEVDGNIVEKFIMDRAVFYFVNKTLEKWEILNPVVEKPLDIAFESLKKVQEIDVAGKKIKKVNELYTKLKGLYVSEGSNCYGLKNYNCSYDNFNKVITIGELPQLNQKDTAIYYFTALAAQYAGKNQEAIDLYKKAIQFNYTSDGNAYCNIDQAFKALGDKESGLQYLEEGFVKNPKNAQILIALINYYISKNEDPSKVLNYIDKAIEGDPKNPSLYNAKATLFDKLNEYDKAVEAYQKSIECDPKFFDSYFNLGVLIYNKGVKYLEEANKLPAKEIEKYDELVAKANGEFRKSIPVFENAHQIMPQDRTTVETLKNIYFRYRNESDDMNKKYQEYNEKLQNLK